MTGPTALDYETAAQSGPGIARADGTRVPAKAQVVLSGVNHDGLAPDVDGPEERGKGVGELGDHLPFTVALDVTKITNVSLG